MSEPEHNRRVSDLTPEGKEPTIVDVWRLLSDMKDRVLVCEARHEEISDAFVLNDLKRPDYDGHRRAHLLQIDEAKKLDDYKMDATKKLIGMFVVFFIGMFTTGLASKFLSEHIK